jgi:hypothetical protein
VRPTFLRTRTLPVLAVVVATLAAAFAPGAGGAERGASASFTPRAAGEPAVAPDARFPVGGPSVAKALEVAAAHWGATPCGGKVEVAWGRLEAGTNAIATWWNPTDAWNNAPQNFNCRIDFNAEMDFDWVKLCTVMAHEAGHLLGRRHVAGDPLMGELYTDELPLCEQTADPAAPAAPTPAPPASAASADAGAPQPQSQPSAAGDRWAGRLTKGTPARPRARRCALTAQRRSTRRVRRFTCGRSVPTLRRAPRVKGWSGA